MATNPHGYLFFSYRRTALEETRVVWEALAEFGIPTWYDLRDLPSGPTEEEIRRAIASDDCGGAVVWLTPSVAESAAVNRIELPEIKARLERADGFWTSILLADGLDYDDLAQAIDPRFNSTFFTGWNARRIGGPLDRPAAVSEVKRLAARRLTELNRLLPEGEPLRLRVHIRQPPPHINDAALVFDWTHLFPEGNRFAAPDAWEGRILPALRDTVGLLAQHAPGRKVVAEGPLTLSGGFALGRAFMAPAGIPLMWQQRSPDGTTEAWELEGDSAPTLFDVSTTAGDYGAVDLALLISVADDVQPAFDATLGSLPAFRAVVHAHPLRGKPPMPIPNSGVARSLARLIVDELRRARSQFRPSGELHVFAAIPVGLAVLIGQLTNTLGPITVYEHVESGNVGTYIPGVRLT